MGFTDKNKVIIKYISLKYGRDLKSVLKCHTEKMEGTAGGLGDLLRRIDRNASTKH